MSFVRFSAGASMTVANNGVRIHWRSGRVDMLTIEGVTADCEAVNLDDMLVHIRTPNGIFEVAKAEPNTGQYLAVSKIDWWVA